jgi:hypothetical protein
VAAQVQALSTNFFRKKIPKEETESKCWLCKEYEETIDHLTSECLSLAKNEHIIGHDKACTHVHYSLHKELDIDTAENLYSNIPKALCEDEDITVL